MIVKKTVILFSTILTLLFFLVSCAPQPSEPTTPTVKTPATRPTITPSDIPTTGEAPVDDVAEDISGAETIDDELSTEDLGDIDDILADIQNI